MTVDAMTGGWHYVAVAIWNCRLTLGPLELTVGLALGEERLLFDAFDWL
jgi:hypothetical protein